MISRHVVDRTRSQNACFVELAAIEEHLAESQIIAGAGDQPAAPLRPSDAGD